MNETILRFLALNGASLIYAVAKAISEGSETKIHYPTVNRRIHDLVERGYIETAGSKITKAGVVADAYVTTLKGDFAALAGRGRGDKMPPHDVRKLVTSASARNGSPFVLLHFMFENGHEMIQGLEQVLSELTNGIRTGQLNLDATDEDVACSQFGYLIARVVTGSRESSGASEATNPKFVNLLLSGIEHTIQSSQNVRATNSQTRQPTSLNNDIPNNHESNPLRSVSGQWCRELKVFLRLGYLTSD